MILRGTVDNRHLDRWVRWSLEKLAFAQPQVSIQGLYKIGNAYSILINDDLTITKSTDGKSLAEWFKNNRAMTAPVTLVNAVPTDAVPVPFRTKTQMITISGDPLTLNDLYDTLNLTLPKKSPPFIIEEINEEVTIRLVFNGKLGYFMLRRIKAVLRSLQAPLCMEIYEAELAPSKPAFRTPASIDLILRRSWPNIPKHMRILAERDEDFWRSKREKLFNDSRLKATDVLPKAFRHNRSACVINASVFPQANIRNYLTVFEKVYIVPPVEDREEAVIASFGVTWDELQELAAINRVAFILPQSLHRYHRSGISGIADSFPETILLSRQLAAASILDTRQRFPFLYPALDAKERYQLLHALTTAIPMMENPAAERMFGTMAKSLGRHYESAEFMIHKRGAMATPALGLGSLMADLYEARTGKNAFIEFFAASENIEIGAALGAAVIPSSHPEAFEGEEQNTHQLAEFYSGIGKASIDIFLSQHKTVLSGVLSIGEDVPVLELAKTFKGNDVTNLRKVIKQIQDDAGPSIGNLESAIKGFNSEVLRYENSSKRLGEFDIKGLLRGVATVGSGVLPIIGDSVEAKVALSISPLALWALSVIAIKRTKLGVVAPLIDKMASMITKSRTSTVLVARLKKRAGLL